MLNLPYLEKFDDSALAEAIDEARENDLDARSYAELFYLPYLLIDIPFVLYLCLQAVQNLFIR